MKAWARAAHEPGPGPKQIGAGGGEAIGTLYENLGHCTKDWDIVRTAAGVGVAAQAKSKSNGMPQHSENRAQPLPANAGSLAKPLRTKSQVRSVHRLRSLMRDTVQ